MFNEYMFSSEVLTCLTASRWFNSENGLGGSPKTGAAA
jgi:hypothetical protein